jgi:hypothetical protein
VATIGIFQLIWEKESFLKFQVKKETLLWAVLGISKF